MWPAYKESGASPERLREVVERLKPLSIASLVTAYEVAMDDTKREGIARRAGDDAAARPGPERTRAPGSAGQRRLPGHGATGRWATS